MFSFFRKLFGKASNSQQLDFRMPSPNTDNEYEFYKFVESTAVDDLEKALNFMIGRKSVIKPQYKEAIEQKISSGYFENPHTFESYFNNKFDYIGIDFETANEARSSACALGLAFVQNNALVDDVFYYIRPLDNVEFSDINTRIHGITWADVDDALDFKELWDTHLKEIFNNNLLVLHNASMDASILEQLFNYYRIDDYDITYICTMKLAKSLNYPGQLISLCKHFNIKTQHLHNPQYDAIMCVNVAAKLFPLVMDIDDRKDVINPKKSAKKTKKRSTASNRDEIFSKNQAEDHTCLESLSAGISFMGSQIDRKFLFPKKSTDENTREYFVKKKIVITGELEHFEERNDLAKLLWELGADVDTKVSKRTNILVTGDGYGYRKIEEMQENIDNGYDAIIINEEQLLELIESTKG